MNRLSSFFTGLSVSCWLGCAAPYHPIGPEEIKFTAVCTGTIQNGQVEVAWQYEVLKASGNRKYAKKEARAGISLLAMRINNQMPDTLFLPGSLLMFAGPDTLEALSLEEALEALLQTSDDEKKQDVVEVELEAPLINFAIGFFNTAVALQADIRFSKETQERYLVPSSISPGKTVIGLVALPVKSGTPLTFVYRLQP